MEALNAMHTHTHTIRISISANHPQNDIQRTTLCVACVRTREVRAQRAGAYQGAHSKTWTYREYASVLEEMSFGVFDSMLVTRWNVQIKKPPLKPSDASKRNGEPNAEIARSGRSRESECDISQCVFSPPKLSDSGSIRVLTKAKKCWHISRGDFTRKQNYWKYMRNWWFMWHQPRRRAVKLKEMHSHRTKKGNTFREHARNHFSWTARSWNCQNRELLTISGQTRARKMRCRSRACGNLVVVEWIFFLLFFLLLSFIRLSRAALAFNDISGTHTEDVPTCPPRVPILDS